MNPTLTRITCFLSVITLFSCVEDLNQAHYTQQEQSLEGEITLSIPPFQVGEVADMMVTGAMEDERVLLVRGTELGDGPCPPLLGGTCLDISGSLTILVRSRADVDGVAEFHWPVPEGAPLGMTFCMQTFIKRGPDGIDSVLSNAVCGVTCTGDGCVSCTPGDGSDPACPGLGCNEILSDSFSTGDGIYWIDPDGDGGEPAYETYCIMEPGVSPSTGYAMNFIPPGTFDMGCTPEMEVDDGCNDYEYPVHKVTLTQGFYMGQTEVTQGQWETVMGSLPSDFEDCDDCPVRLVSWLDAVAFANTLSDLDGRTPAYTIAGTEVSWNQGADGYRLPTEAEWEYAARGGDGTPYAGSNNLDEVAWYNDTAGSPQPVGLLAPNGNGLYDMSGNVFELCWDWHSVDYYLESPETDPTGPEGPLIDRVSRGGGYAYGPNHMRLSDRNRRDTPTSAWNFTGFRLVHNVTPPPEQETFALIPAGTFIMGSPEDELGREDDELQHEVTLTQDFYMGTTEVTQADWEAVMGNTPSAFTDCGGDCPVDSVNWWDALTYTNSLSSAEGLPECYTLNGCLGTAGIDLNCSGVTVNTAGGNPYLCEGYRLPTEAEWEYAARAGTLTATYAGDLTSTGCDDLAVAGIAWFCGDDADSTHPVATKAPNDFGLYDMSGNVWEWVFDTWAGYPEGGITDPFVTGTNPVNRGGGWYSDGSAQRSANRGLEGANNRNNNVGFRVVH